jgi:hypothetical protein
VSFFVKDNPVPEFPRLTHFGYCDDDSLRSVPAHVHLGYEIVFIEAGHGEVVCKGGDNPIILNADDVMMTRSRVRHRFVVHGAGLAYAWFGLQTDPVILRTPIHKMNSFPLLPPVAVDRDYLGEPMFREIFEHLGQKMGDAEYLVLHRVPGLSGAFSRLKDEVHSNRSQRGSLIYAALIEIFARLNRRLESGPRSSRHAVLNDLIDFIQAHYGEVLSLDRLCEFSGYSPAYLSRIFPRGNGFDREPIY